MKKREELYESKLVRYREFTKHWVERKVIGEIKKELARDKTRLIVLKGDTGVGKTAIAAKLATELKTPCILIGKGALREAATIDILKELAKQINHYYEGIEILVSGDESKLFQDTVNNLEKIAESLEEPFIIIDAVDEAEEPEKLISYIPRMLESAKIMITYRTGSQKLEDEISSLEHGLMDAMKIIESTRNSKRNKR